MGLPDNDDVGVFVRRMVSCFREARLPYYEVLRSFTKFVDRCKDYSFVALNFKLSSSILLLDHLRLRVCVCLGASRSVGLLLRHRVQNSKI